MKSISEISGHMWPTDRVFETLVLDQMWRIRVLTWRMVSIPSSKIKIFRFKFTLLKHVKYIENIAL